MSAKGMTRLHKFKLSEVLPHIGKVEHKFWIPEKNRLVSVRHLSNTRMNLIARTQQCAACLITGNHFWLETSGCFPIHFNLYAPNIHGYPTLMTMDHILPKSKGGKATPDNVQLLCERCNRGKKNLMITAEDILRMRFRGDTQNFLFNHMKTFVTPEQLIKIEELHANRHKPIVEQDISCFIKTGEPSTPEPL